MDTSTASSQRSVIQSQLETHGRMSTQYARDELGIPHPAGRICELRQSGLNIITHWRIEYTPDGEPHRMADYVLTGGKYKEIDNG